MVTASSSKSRNLVFVRFGNDSGGWFSQSAAILFGDYAFLNISDHGWDALQSWTNSVACLRSPRECHSEYSGYVFFQRTKYLTTGFPRLYRWIPRLLSVLILRNFHASISHSDVTLRRIHGSGRSKGSVPGFDSSWVTDITGWMHQCVDNFRLYAEFLIFSTVGNGPARW